DNVWWESHLARKGIPRVFLETQLGAKTVADLAFGAGALTSSEDKTGFHHYHFDRQDPHSTAAALDTCTDALAALWGPSLWPARPRRVRAALVGNAALEELSRPVALVSWWEADHYYLFACTGRALQHWRRDLRRHGGLEVQLHYLHALSPPAPDLDAERSADFSSEPFDHEAFLPAPLSFKAAANELPHSAILHAPPHAPGRPAAGSRRPLVDVVEFCAASAPAPAKRAPELPPCGNFQAWILKATCWGGGDPRDRTELIGADGYAGVACWSPSHNFCFSALLPRNRTWQLRGQTIGNCFSSSATFYHARHICQALNATLPTSQQIVGCCSIGCYGLSRVWLNSEVPECYQEYDSPPPVLPFAPEDEPIGVPTKVPDRRAQEELARAFLRKHEEARSTEIEWDPPLKVREDAGKKT
ncbi:unnamed protein product, partial [Symbiodinium sp. CCMP2456]